MIDPAFWLVGGVDFHIEKGIFISEEYLTTPNGYAVAIVLGKGCHNVVVNRLVEMLEYRKINIICNNASLFPVIVWMVNERFAGS